MDLVGGCRSSPRDRRQRSDTLVVAAVEGSWTGSSTLPHLHHIPPPRRGMLSLTGNRGRCGHDFDRFAIGHDFDRDSKALRFVSGRSGPLGPPRLEPRRRCQGTTNARFRARHAEPLRLDFAIDLRKGPVQPSRLPTLSQQATENPREFRPQRSSDRCARRGLRFR
jgi:hypothetical protein